MCNTLISKFYYPLVVVGLVAIGIVHGHSLESFDNLETHLNQLFVKNTHIKVNMCNTLTTKFFYPLVVVGLVAVVVVHGMSYEPLITLKPI